VRRWDVAYAFYFDVPANDELYAEIRDEFPSQRPDGLLMHLVTRGGRGLRYIDVWESKASWEAARDAILEPAAERVLARHGLPHDESLTQFEELDVIDLWGAIEPDPGL
jgi:hypothetical protein